MRCARFLWIAALAACRADDVPAAPEPTAKETATTAAPLGDRAGECRALIVAVNRTVADTRRITAHVTGDGTRELERLEKANDALTKAVDSEDELTAAINEACAAR